MPGVPLLHSLGLHVKEVFFDEISPDKLTTSGAHHGRDRKLPKRFLAGAFLSLFVCFFTAYFILHFINLESSSKNVLGRTIHLRKIHPDFVGREDYLNFIEKTLLKKRRHNEVEALTIWGEGGVGKTEVAIAFANKYHKNFSFIYLIDCSSKERYQQTYTALAQELKVPFCLKEPIEITLQKVHGHLEARNTKKPWLLILDNVEGFLEFPQRGNGAVLITARDKEPWGSFPSLLLEPFSPLEASKLFKKVLGEKGEKISPQLAIELDYFPLALSLAAHYISETPGITEENYLALLKQNKILLLEQRPQYFLYPHALSVSWKVTLDHLSQNYPEALDCLLFCSYLHPYAIPKTWLEEWLEVYSKQGDPSLSKLKINHVLKILKNQSLIKYNENDNTFFMHQLKQEIIKNHKEKKHEIQNKVLAFLVKKVKGFEYIDEIEWRPDSLDVLNVWSLHTSWFLAHTNLTSSTEDLAALYNVLGNYLVLVQGKYQEGIDHYNEALFLKQQHSKEKPLPGVPTIYRNIGSTWFYEGNFEEAIKNNEKALAIAKEVYKDEVNIELAYATLGLGFIYRWSDFLDRSLEFVQKALSHFKTIYGPQPHPAVAEALKLLASIYSDLGDDQEAISYAKQALEMNKQYTKGKPTLQRSLILSVMGYSCGELEKWEKALSCYEEALKTIHKLYLNKQIELRSALILNGLGHVHKNLGNYRKSLFFYKKSLEITHYLFNNKPHQFTCISLTGLGKTYHVQGKYKKAIRLFKKSIKMNNDIYKYKPNVSAISTLNGLGSSYCCINNHEEGRKCFNNALALVNELYKGKETQDTADTLYLLGKSYLTDDPEKSMQYFIQSYNIYLRILGEGSSKVKELKQLIDGPYKRYFNIRVLELIKQGE